eukprot:TRINITY_DN3212_c0_g1_i1.p1 TRINITY_DN3212_c0_g1~~TRINITY_DN3212_c0_g1_i1.p1  ORF type:complete len:240 (+),score=10.65 TRINITY_DN3212_c0_g1_i1:78-797(+)
MKDRRERQVISQKKRRNHIAQNKADNQAELTKERNRLKDAKNKIVLEKNQHQLESEEKKVHDNTVLKYRTIIFIAFVVGWLYHTNQYINFSNALVKMFDWSRNLLESLFPSRSEQQWYLSIPGIMGKLVPSPLRNALTNTMSAVFSFIFFCVYLFILKQFKHWRLQFLALTILYFFKSSILRATVFYSVVLLGQLFCSRFLFRYRKKFLIYEAYLLGFSVVGSVLGYYSAKYDPENLLD